MFNLDSLVMALLTSILLWVVNDYVPIAPLINLVFNFFLLIILVLYIMQFFGAIRAILPTFKLFK